MKSLTKPERETVINWSDEGRLAYIWTAQRPVITKLKANRDAEIINEGFIGTTAWAEFRLPAVLISFRQKQKRASAATQAKRTEALRKARAAKGKPQSNKRTTQRRAAVQSGR